MSKESYKTSCAVLGTGNIGTDLLYKILKSKHLNCSAFIGRRNDSNGILIAKDMNINTSVNSINYILDNPNCCDIIFDATSASCHKEYLPYFKKLNKFVIDLTPAKTGVLCCPIINLEKAVLSNDVNMITCGGQASLPIAYAIKKVFPKVDYIEIVASIASKSAGIGTRNNIDEFTQTTADAIKYFTGVTTAKAIIILNPAEPPITMRNTIYARINNYDLSKLTIELKRIEAKIRNYVPGYHIITGPIYDNNRLTIIVEVVGAGDYLPKYAGNLDIITSAAVKIAEEYVKRRL